MIDERADATNPTSIAVVPAAATAHPVRMTSTMSPTRASDRPDTLHPSATDAGPSV